MDASHNNNKISYQAPQYLQTYQEHLIGTEIDRNM